MPKYEGDKIKHSIRIDLPQLSVSLTPVPWRKMRFSGDNEEIIEKNQTSTAEKNETGQDRNMRKCFEQFRP